MVKRHLLGFLTLALAIVACDEDVPVKTGGVSSGDPKGGTMATDFTTRDVNGKTFNLHDHLGKDVILIDFWATWCQPCIAEFPHLQKMYDEQKAKGFVVLAVSMDGSDTIAEVPSFARRNNVTFPVLLDEDSHIAAIYNPRKSAPLSALIDRKGRVVAVREGYNPGDEVPLYADVKKYVDEPKAPPTPAVPAN